MTKWTDTLVHDAKVADVGGLQVRRALPRLGLRTVGAWCFADHMGPEVVTESSGLDVGPHPHMGLQTVTWLIDGAVLHTDSLGSEQLIRPGQLNLMTAGRGIVHAEESVRARSASSPADSPTQGTLHGVQLWIAQPSATRDGASAFAHHHDLPRIDVGHGSATVFIGEYADAVSDAHTDTALVGVDLDLRAGTSVWPLRADFEYAAYVISGEVAIHGAVHSTSALSIPAHEGQLVDLRVHGDEIRIEAPRSARLLLLGGEPLGEPLYMWWNFVGRSRDEIAQAARDWSGYVDMGARESTARFERVASTLAPIAAPALI